MQRKPAAVTSRRVSRCCGVARRTVLGSAQRAPGPRRSDGDRGDMIRNMIGTRIPPPELEVSSMITAGSMAGAMPPACAVPETARREAEGGSGSNTFHEVNPWQLSSKMTGEASRRPPTSNSSIRRFTAPRATSRRSIADPESRKCHASAALRVHRGTVVSKGSTGCAALNASGSVASLWITVGIVIPDPCVRGPICARSLADPFC
jgi:hypothetical protein